MDMLKKNVEAQGNVVRQLKVCASLASISIAVQD